MRKQPGHLKIGDELMSVTEAVRDQRKETVSLNDSLFDIMLNECKVPAFDGESDDKLIQTLLEAADKNGVEAPADTMRYFGMAGKKVYYVNLDRTEDGKIKKIDVVDETEQVVDTVEVGDASIAAVIVSLMEKHGLDSVSYDLLIDVGIVKKDVNSKDQNDDADKPAEPEQPAEDEKKEEEPKDVEPAEKENAGADDSVEVDAGDEKKEKGAAIEDSVKPVKEEKKYVPFEAAHAKALIRNDIDKSLLKGDKNFRSILQSVIDNVVGDFANRDVEDFVREYLNKKGVIAVGVRPVDEKAGAGRIDHDALRTFLDYAYEYERKSYEETDDKKSHIYNTIVALDKTSEPKVSDLEKLLSYFWETEQKSYEEGGERNHIFLVMKRLRDAAGFSKNNMPDADDETNEAKVDEAKITLSNFKEEMIKKAKAKGGVWEDFGQKELRKLRDEVLSPNFDSKGYYDKRNYEEHLKELSDWASNFDLSQLKESGEANESKSDDRQMALSRHYRALERLAMAVGGPVKDGKELSLKLLKIERNTRQAAEDAANAKMTNEDLEKVVAAAQRDVQALFGGKLKGFVVNTDPRGTALKIDADLMQTEYSDVGLQRDLGGDGMLSPDIDVNESQDEEDEDPDSPEALAASYINGNISDVKRQIKFNGKLLAAVAKSLSEVDPKRVARFLEIMSESSTSDKKGDQKYYVRAFSQMDADTGPFNSYAAALKHLKASSNYGSFQERVKAWGGTAESYLDHMIVPIASESNMPDKNESIKTVDAVLKEYFAAVESKFPEVVKELNVNVSDAQSLKDFVVDTLNGYDSTFEGEYDEDDELMEADAEGNYSSAGRVADKIKGGVKLDAEDLSELVFQLNQALYDHEIGDIKVKGVNESANAKAKRTKKCLKESAQSFADEVKAMKESDTVYLGKADRSVTLHKGVYELNYGGSVTKYKSLDAIVKHLKDVGISESVVDESTKVVGFVVKGVNIKTKKESFANPLVVFTDKDDAEVALKDAKTLQGDEYDLSIVPVKFTIGGGVVESNAKESVEPYYKDQIDRVVADGKRSGYGVKIQIESEGVHTNWLDVPKGNESKLYDIFDVRGGVAESKLNESTTRTGKVILVSRPEYKGKYDFAQVDPIEVFDDVDAAKDRADELQELERGKDVSYGVASVTMSIDKDIVSESKKLREGFKGVASIQNDDIVEYKGKEYVVIGIAPGKSYSLIDIDAVASDDVDVDPISVKVSDVGEIKKTGRVFDYEARNKELGLDESKAQTSKIVTVKPGEYVKGIMDDKGKFKSLSDTELNKVEAETKGKVVGQEGKHSVVEIDGGVFLLVDGVDAEQAKQDEPVGLPECKVPPMDGEKDDETIKALMEGDKSNECKIPKLADESDDKLIQDLLEREFGVRECNVPKFDAENDDELIKTLLEDRGIGDESNGMVKKPVADVKDKGEAQQIAIDYQKWQSERSMSQNELLEWDAYFQELARRFGLEEEFKENGII